MKDSMKPCQHALSDEVVYKEVVVIGNGPSGMVTSFMLAGNVPYLKQLPEDLPIDEMLRARLSNLPPGQSLYEADLMELAEGLEGRSHNPIPLLMDNLLRPCADIGIEAEPLIEWKYDIEKQIDHIVVGRGPPGGAWHTFPPGVRTLSPAAWLTLPPHSAGAGGGGGGGRLSARAVAQYCRRYVHACQLQRFFRSGVVVTSVSLVPRAGGPPCASPSCPNNATYCVSGYDKSEGRPFRYVCRRVVVACGAGDRPNTLAPPPAPAPAPAPPPALHALADVERAVHVLRTHAPPVPNGSQPSVLIVGSGVSAADAVWLALRAGLRVRHAHRAPAGALARLPARHYPDYCQVYKMMCDGSSGNYTNYTSYPEHIIVEVTPIDSDTKLNPEDIEDNALRLKRVKLLNVTTNQTTEITVSLIAVLIGSKPDLFFLQTNFDLNCIDVKKCTKCSEETKLACSEETKHASKRKIEDETQPQCFLKNHWYYFKSVLGQSIQSCKSRYLNYTEINGNTESIPDCNEKKCSCVSQIEDGIIKTSLTDRCDVIPYSEPGDKCTCDQNPYSSGIGFGVDPKKPVDGRSNPIAIDKSTHELLNAPKGMYALGPLTADNFVRFIPGGALAIVASIHKENKD